MKKILKLLIGLIFIINPILAENSSKIEQPTVQTGISYGLSPSISFSIQLNGKPLLKKEVTRIKNSPDELFTGIQGGMGVSSLMRNGPNLFVIDFKLEDDPAKYADLPPVKYLNNPDRYVEYRKLFRADLRISQSSDKDQYNKALIYVGVRVNENNQLYAFIPPYDPEAPYDDRLDPDDLSRLFFMTEEVVKYGRDPNYFLDSLQWMRDNIKIEQISDKKVRVTISPISVGLPQRTWETATTYNEAEHRELLEAGYKKYWQVLKDVEDSQNWEPVKDFYGEAIRNITLYEGNPDSVFRLIHPTAYMKGKLQSLGDLSQYRVEIVNDGKKVQLVDKMAGLSPVTYENSSWLLFSKIESLMPYFSIINGEAVLTEF